VVTVSSPFGGQTRTRLLLALRLLDESYPRELARVLGVPINGVQTAIRGLARDGLVTVRAAGRTQLVRLNPRYFARAEFERFLLRLTEPEADLQRQVAALRRRPRRPGKPV